MIEKNLKNEVPNFHSFQDFWPYYLAQHSTKPTRIFHLIGPVLVLIVAAITIVTREWKLVLLIPALGYLPAWFGHLFFERNLPATFANPIYSFIAEFKMLALLVTGRLK